MFDPESYTIIASIFPRLLGLIYFFAIGALLFQIKGLIGKNGIQPVVNFLNSMHYLTRTKTKLYTSFPTLFWFGASDSSLIGVTILGLICSIVLIFGFLPSLMLLSLYIIYLSIRTVGQDFLSYGWEGLFLEITVQGFLMSLTAVPNIFVWISINLLLFRFHLQAGFIKLQTHDPAWRNLTAIAYHYETQPLPNVIAWYFHKLPLNIHKFSSLLVFFIEIILPFGIFFGQDSRIIVFIGFFFLQFMIWFTGNFSFLNQLTAVFCTILIGNKFLSSFLPPPIIERPFPFFEYILSFIGILFILLQIIRLWHQFYPNYYFNKVLYWISPFFLANRYAIFGNMTKKRFEVVVEGSEDGIVWKEYCFKYKPSEITRRPRWFSPYQPRLDWQAWFLPFREYYYEDWYQSFLYHLLKGTPEVLALIRENPFKEYPPKYIRSSLYLYRFSTFKEKREKGCWWIREHAGLYSPGMTLKE